MAADLAAVIVFTDIRGFTRRSETTEVFARLGEFVGQYIELLRRHFPKKHFYLKPLGDGAMIVQEVPTTLDAPAAADVLRSLLATAQRAQGDFLDMSRRFGEAIGHAAGLTLGWGVVRGAVQRLEPRDYVGSNVNKSARLCDLARPFGFVIDRDDFPLPPAATDLTFYPQLRKLAGIGDVAVWATEEVATQFLTRERLRQTPEVHVAGQCIDATGKKGPRLLIAKRSERRSILPGRYEGCGGQLAAGETFSEGVARHFRMEMNIQVRVLEEFHRFYAIREPDHPVIPGIRFLCERVDDSEPNSPNHSEVRWVGEKEFRGMGEDVFVPGLKEQVLELLRLYRAK